MGTENSSGFGLDSPDKLTTTTTPRTKSVVDHEKIDGYGTDFFLKLQRTESFPYKMMLNQNHSTPTFCSSGDGSRLTSNIYGGGGGGGGARTLEAFNNSVFRSPVGMAATGLKFPFTSAQYQELERQALIYKYMMHSVPIPPDLILPITRNLSGIPSSHSTYVGRNSSCFNLRFSNNTDPEPGRCRRTDGKKWRCSRDVAPDQKYCERHMHRGRPRSRKHVEVQTEINNKTNLSVPPMAVPINTTTKSYNLASGFSSKPDFKVPPFESMASSSTSSIYRDNNTRCMEWMMKRDAIPIASASNQQLEQMMNSKAGLRTNNNSIYTSSPVFQQQQHQETLSLNSYGDFGSETVQRDDQFGLFLNPELPSLDDNLSSDQRQIPRRFIDAWSTSTDNSKPTETTINKYSPSNLSLSMSGFNSTEDEIDGIEMGIGLKSQSLSWMSPVPWMNSQPGGPLGEVLQSSNGTSKSSINGGGGGGGLSLMTDGTWIGSNGHENSSPRLTTISSPSGVLHKTLASLSDSSGTSSPNSLSVAAKSEIALQLLNQTKLQ